MLWKHKCVVCGGSGECAGCYGSGKNIHLNTEGEICEVCRGDGLCRNCGGEKTGFRPGDLLKRFSDALQGRKSE